MRALRSLALVAFLVVLTASSAAAAISGAVINVDGQPVAGARVSVFAPESPSVRRARFVSKSPQPVLLASTKTDAKGSFTLEPPKLPVIELRFEADGYAPEAIRVTADDELGAVAMARAETKTGTVTANGKPVAGATVVWGTGYLTTTDANGKYTVPDPAKFASRVFVYHPDYAPAEESAFVFAGDRIKVDRTLEAGVAISGKVVGDDGKSPIANATILVDDVPLATSAQDGTFTVAHAPKKWEKVEARTDLRSGMRARGAAGEVVIKTAKAATLAGVVRDAKTQTPLAGAAVSVGLGLPRMASAESAIAFTDAKGNYTINVPPGSYELTVSRPGYVGAQASASVAAGQVVVKSFNVAQTARIVGSVVDEDKRPVSGARVQAQAVTRDAAFPGSRMFGSTPNVTPYSGPDGRFVVRSESDTDVQVEAVKKGYPSAKSASMHVGPGERKGGVVLTIPRGMEVTGRVVDQKGNPLGGVTVASNEAAGDTNAILRRVVMSAMRDRGDDLVRTDAQGRFTLRVKEGSYDFAFKREGFAPKTLRAQAVSSAMKPLEVTLDPAAEITGRVTRGGTGVEGAMVNAIGESMASATTSFDGSFRLSDLGPGQLMLSVTKLDEMIQQVRPVTAPAHDVTIEIPPGGRISGRVTDKATGAPVTSFQAGVSTPRGGGGMVFMMPPAMRPFTTDDGTFVLENVPAGQTQLVVSAPGYTTGRVPNLTVEEGKSLANVEVALDTGVKLTGRVTGPDGAPLSGVAVRQDMAAGRVMRMPASGDGAAVTDANGEYSIEALEPGEKTFVFQRGGYLQQSKTVTLSGKETKLDAQMSTGQRVTGVVVTEAGAPVPDAMIRATSAAESGFGGKSTRTDSSGTFTFEGMSPGHYTFTASKSGYADGMLRDFDVVSGGAPRVVLRTGGVIYGHVSGLTAAELAQTSVRAFTVNGGSSATVDAGGNFRIEDAPTGTVRVTAQIQQGFGGGKQSPMKSVQVEPGSSAQVDLEFKSDTVITGRITRGGKPLGNAMVSFYPRNGRAQTNARITADAAGTYSVNGLEDAPYAVSVVDLERNVQFTTDYEVKGSGTFDIDVKVATARGRVVDASTGEPLADAHVEFRPAQQGNTMMMARGAATDSSGNYVVDSLSPGSYVATADKDGYGNQVLDVTVTESGAGDVQFKLTPNAGVTLRVVDARNNQLLNAMVRVNDLQGRLVSPPVFRFGGAPEEQKLPLAAGQYRVTISAGGYAPQIVTITSPSTPTVGLTPGGSLLVMSKSSSQQRGRLVMPDGQVYPRGVDPSGIFVIDPSPGATPIPNIAPGTYRLQLLDANDRPTTSVDVTVVERRVTETQL